MRLPPDADLCDSGSCAPSPPWLAFRARVDGCSNLIVPAWRRNLRALTLTGLSLAVATAGSTGEITVQRSKVSQGAWAATLTLGSSCTGARNLEVTGRVANESLVACATLTTDAEIIGPVTLVSGRRIALRPGFRVATGVRFDVRVTPSLHPDAFLTDRAPDSEQTYAARMWVNTDDLDPNPTTRFDHFWAHDSAGELEFRLLVRQGGGSEVLLEVVEDDGTRVSNTGTPLALPANGWHSIEVAWARSSGADDGSARLCIDETDCATLTGLANETGAIDVVHWGARSLEGGGAGSIHLDGFESFRDEIPD